MVNKNSKLESLESKIFQITIANLANVDKPLIDTDFIELNDVNISLDIFKNCFYNNNYKYFEFNPQFQDLEALKIHNKTIKFSNFKNYKNGTKIDLDEIMSYKYIKNKKMKVNDIAKLSFMKEISNFNSLLDFNIYNSNLGFDNILAIFDKQYNKKTKKYFRFKIKANYYSIDFDETLSIYFNFLVKVPKKNKVSDDSSISDSESDFESVDTSNSDESVSETYNENENIVYSNYIRKINKSNFSNRMNLISNLSVKPSVVKPIININNELNSNISSLNADDKEKETDDNDDNYSESNITVSSFENNDSNDSNDSFF